MDVSIFIPIYRESSQLEGMLNELGEQNVSKEIFVTVDQPTEEFLKKIPQFEKENVQFIVNKERVGKANALNSTVKLSTGKGAAFP